MIALQWKQVRQRGKAGVAAWCKDFIRSLAFMSWMVGGMKTALCILNAANAPLDGTPSLS
jgi:hypothetical protein